MHHRHLIAAPSARIALGFCAIVSIQATRALADSPPYQARVIAAGAAVHSGPGENYYSTDTLSQGDTVEVYREKPGGWLAIRPPVNSFSLVSERDLIRKDGGLAEVTKDDVPSRIGSRLNDRHNAAQVRLKKGEAVEVVGEVTFNGENWCKIAPPAGEFRWIQASLVEKAGPITTPTTTSSTTSQSATSAALPASNAGAPPLLPSTKPAGINTPAPANGASPAANASQAPPAANGTPPAAGPVASDLSHDLIAVELRLSRMAAAPTNLWNTERLERDTGQLMARAKTPAERDAVRITQDKIARFNQIARRQNQTPGNIAQAGQSPVTPLPNASVTTANGGPYDAVGILRPVVSRRPGAPQFALVDERGQVVSFVTTTPDLNLQPYLGHRIGVVGNRGFLPEFQRSNVTAARVTPLNDRLVR